MRASEAIPAPFMPLEKVLHPLIFGLEVRNLSDCHVPYFGDTSDEQAIITEKRVHHEIGIVVLAIHLGKAVISIPVLDVTRGKPIVIHFQGEMH
jgi:hypothetical protein